MAERESTKGKILLIDDDENVLDVTQKLLEMSGYEVVPARGGRQGVELFRQAPGEFLAAIVDLTMPEVDGVQVLAEIRESQPQLPVVLSSGYDRVTARGRYGDQGFSGFLQKPYTARILLARIEEALDYAATHAPDEA